MRNTSLSSAIDRSMEAVEVPPMPLRCAFTLVLMGVSGCGKSTVGRLVAGRAGCEFADADDFHPPGNLAKMSAGEALTDEDRAPWLESLKDHIKQANQTGTTVILACSALKRIYRDKLREAGPQVAFVFLSAPRELLLERLKNRKEHFFPASLLDSQLDALEPPTRALVLDATAAPDDLAVQILVPFFNRLP